MNKLKADFQVEELAQALEVSPSGFYAHPLQPERPRAQADQKLVPKSRTIFQESRRT